MQLGEKFAAASKSRDVFALVGTLGTGKTHWTKGVLRQLQPDATVTSPTFGLVNEYPDAKIPTYHFDFYRLKTSDELISLGWDEYLGEQGIMICEWADLFPEIFPEHTQWLHPCEPAASDRHDRAHPHATPVKLGVGDQLDRPMHRRGCVERSIKTYF